MTNSLQTRFDAELNRHYDACRALATERVQAFIKFWKRTYPKKELRITFGMGSWLIQVDGKQVDSYFDSAPKYWRDFEDDLTELTLEGKLSLDDVIVGGFAVNWDNGSEACGTFSDRFDTEAEAEAFATEWMNERNLEDLHLSPKQVERRGGEGCYTAEAIRLEANHG